MSRDVAHAGLLGALLVAALKMSWSEIAEGGIAGRRDRKQTSALLDTRSESDRDRDRSEGRRANNLTATWDRFAPIALLWLHPDRPIPLDV